MNSTMETFYKDYCEYCGLMYSQSDGFIKPIIEDEKPFLIGGKKVTLPYHSNLKNPGDRLIIHPLNENYTTPENATFTALKKRLTKELNLKFNDLFLTLLYAACDVEAQQKCTNSSTLELISNIGVADITIVERLQGVIKAAFNSEKEEFFFGFYLKKNAEFGGKHYGATGKVVFKFYNEITKALENGEYKLFGHKSTKKDILVYKNIFEVIFKGIENPDLWVETTDNKVFRLFNVLLKTSLLVSMKINDTTLLLNKLPKYGDKVTLCNLKWVDSLKLLYDLTQVIRAIPNQNDPRIPNPLSNEGSSTSQQPSTNNTPSLPQAPPQLPQQYQSNNQPSQVKNDVPSLDDLMSQPQYGRPLLQYPLQTNTGQFYNNVQPQLPLQYPLNVNQPFQQLPQYPQMQQPMVQPYGMNQYPIQQPMVPPNMMNPQIQQIQQPLQYPPTQQPMVQPYSMNPYQMVQPMPQTNVNPYAGLPGAPINLR